MFSASDRAWVESQGGKVMTVADAIDWHEGQKQWYTEHQADNQESSR